MLCVYIPVVPKPCVEVAVAQFCIIIKFFSIQIFALPSLLFAHCLTIACYMALSLRHVLDIHESILNKSAFVYCHLTVYI